CRSADPVAQGIAGDGMNLKEIKELLDIVVEKGFTEFEFERAGTKLRLKREISGSPSASHSPIITYAQVPMAIPTAVAAPALAAAPPAEAAPAVEENLHIIKSPIVGTFYEAASPTSAP